MDEVLDSVIEQTAPVEQVQEAVNVKEAVKSPVEDAQERNWRQVRQQMKELERELKHERELREQAQRLAPSQPKEVDEFDAIGSEEFIPKGKIEKLAERKAQQIAETIVKRETERIMREQEQSQFLDRLNRQYSDFGDIVNPTTLQLLEEQEPELAKTIADQKDPYKIGMQSYKYIKALNIAGKVPETRRSKEVEKKLEKNAQTVQSPQAYDKRPMAQAFQMSEDERNSIYDEMMRYARQGGNSF